MIGTQPLQFQDRKLRLLEDETTSLEALDTTRNGESVVLVEQLVAECLHCPDEMERIWKYVRKVITSGVKVDYEKTGVMLRELFARLLHLLARVHTAATEINKASGRKVERVDDMLDALVRLQKME